MRAGLRVAAVMGPGSRVGGLGLLFAGAWLLTALPALAGDTTCTKRQFEAVVGESAGALRDLNAQNRPMLQERLRELKDKRGWSHDQFLKLAAPLVQDDTTAKYDREATDYLEKIESMGAEGAAAKEPDCALLGQLRGYMESLVASQKAKWQYILHRVDAELAK